MARAKLDEIRNLMYRIETALDDVDADVSDDESGAALRQALWHLYRSCAEVRTISVEPLALGSRELSSL